MELKLYSAEDSHLEGIVMAIIKPISPDGDIRLLEYGRGFVPSTEGIMVYLEERYIMDLEQNFQLKTDALLNPSIVSKPGLNYIPPQEDLLELKAKELKRELEKVYREQQKVQEEMFTPVDEELALKQLDEEIENRTI